VLAIDASGDYPRCWVKPGARRSSTTAEGEPVTTQQTYRFGQIDPRGSFQNDATVTVVDDHNDPVLTVRAWTESSRTESSRTESSRTETRPPTTGTADPGPVAVVAATGDIDVDTAPALQHLLRQALNNYPTVCCDLSQVTFFGAAAANLLLTLHRHATETGHHLHVRGAHAMTQRVLTIVDPHHTVTRY